jgi:alpha-L-arabinofuranosidase
LPVGLEQKLHDMQRQIDQAGKPNVHIAFTEWLFHCCRSGGNDAPRFDNFAGAIAAAGFLNMILRNANIVPISDMTGIVEFAGIWKKRSQVFATPSYYAFQMFSTAAPEIVLRVENNSPTYDVHYGVSRLPEIPNVPYLDTVAVRTSRGISLFCVNRNLNQDLEAAIVLDGVNLNGAAHVQELTAPSLYAVNDEDRPAAIRPRTLTMSITNSRSSFVFRHASITRIDFDSR